MKTGISINGILMKRCGVAIRAERDGVKPVDEVRIGLDVACGMACC